MTKRELITLLENPRAVPDDAHVFVLEPVTKPDRLIPVQESNVHFLIDRFGTGTG